jgi:hypothetical protein
LSVILLWKVDLRVIVNSPSCLSLESQVTDQILTYALDKRCFLTSEIDLLISLYSLGRSSSDTEPSSTEGSSWRCSGEPEVDLELRIMGWSSPYIPPCSGSLPLSGNRFIAFLWKSNTSQGLIQGCLHWVSPCLWESIFPLSLSPPLVGGNVVESSSWVLTLRLCQSSRLLSFWILETWQSSVTLADFLTLTGS